MKRLISTLLAVAALLLGAAAPAFANPLPYINSPMDTPQALVNQLVSSINTSQPEASYISYCTGTTTATCLGIRMQVSITGLTTAAGGVSSANMTVTDTTVVAASQILCQVNGYTGTGQPVATAIVPAAGTFTVAVTNVASSGSLNATVPIECFVFN